MWMTYVYAALIVGGGLLAALLIARLTDCQVELEYLRDRNLNLTWQLHNAVEEVRILRSELSRK